MSGTLAFTFARMNPPTVGHERLINVMKKMPNVHDRYLFLSGSNDADKNPLPFKRKYDLCKKAFQDIDLIVSQHPQKDFFTTMEWIAHMGYSSLVVIVGSDRYEELNYRLRKYNGSLYHFAKIDVVGVPRDNGDYISGMSSSKMREMAKLNYYDSFEDGLPNKLRPMGREIFEEVRTCASRALESS